MGFAGYYAYMETAGIEEILKSADELGLLIQDTDAYRQYRRLEEIIEADPERAGLLSRYEEDLRVMEARRARADIIENFEIESLGELADMIRDDPLIMEYLEAKKEYVYLLEEINGALTGTDEE